MLKKEKQKFVKYERVSKDYTSSVESKLYGLMQSKTYNGDTTRAATRLAIRRAQRLLNHLKFISIEPTRAIL